MLTESFNSDFIQGYNIQELSMPTSLILILEV